MINSDSGGTSDDETNCDSTQAWDSTPFKNVAGRSSIKDLHGAKSDLGDGRLRNSKTLVCRYSRSDKIDDKND